MLKLGRWRWQARREAIKKCIRNQRDATINVREIFEVAALTGKFFSRAIPLAVLRLLANSMPLGIFFVTAKRPIRAGNYVASN